MNFWNAVNLTTVTGGSWVVRPRTDGEGRFVAGVSGLSIDSREIAPGQVFVAIKGDKFDGHTFLDGAAAAGSPLLIVSDDSAVSASLRHAPAGPAVLKVADTVQALQRLGAAYRKALPAIRVIGVTGSNGKTTTTRLIDAVLRTKLRGSHSIKSFNNHIGVPLTLLWAAPADQYVVAEMGMNHAGEIAPLTAMARPDIAVITSVGRAHIEALGSIDAIAREKASIFNGLAEGGLAVASADVPQLAEHLRRLDHVMTFGRSASADLRLTTFEQLTDRVKFTVNGKWEYSLPLLGEHNAMNALAAIAVGRRMGLNEQEIAAGLAAAAPPEMRFNRLKIGGVELINDAYNASPESMIAAMKTFAGVFPVAPGRRRVLVLGDMLELGDKSKAAHEEVGRASAEHCPADLLITLGTAARSYALDAGAPEHVAFDSMNDAAAASVASLLRTGDVVLLKASRRMGLERVVKQLEKLSAMTPVA